MLTEMVYQGRDNISKLAFTEEGTAINFSAATRMQLRFQGSSVVADSLYSNEYIQWDAEGNVTLSLGNLPIAPAKYPATLIVYDSAHPDGQVLFHARESKVVFWFVAPDPQ